MTEKDTEKMWAELARYYDVIYDWKDYESESAAIHELIGKQKKSDGHALLDVACGTGSHVQYLSRDYDVMGIDASGPMLKQARKKCPGVSFREADMMSFDLKRQFDVIVCLFSGIGYLRTYRNLRTAIRNFSRHLRPGGLLLIEPFLTPDKYEAGLIHGGTMSGDGVKISRMNITRKSRNIATLDFHFLVATKSGVRYYHDPHELALYETDKFLKILTDAGFRAKFRKQALMKDRGLFVAVKK